MDLTGHDDSTEITGNIGLTEQEISAIRDCTNCWEPLPFTCHCGVAQLCAVCVILVAAGPAPEHAAEASGDQSLTLQQIWSKE